MYDQFRYYRPYHSPNDPCKPIGLKRYIVPPNQYIVYQPTNLPQFPIREALRHGTLWPAFVSPYPGRD